MAHKIENSDIIIGNRTVLSYDMIFCDILCYSSRWNTLDASTASLLFITIVSTTYNDYYDLILSIDPFYVEPVAFLSMVDKNIVVELCKIAQLLLNNNDYN